VIDTTTGTLKLKAVFANNDNALFPSQFVNARLLVDTLHNVTLIPTPGIQRNAQGAFVYVIKSDQTANIRTITPGTTDGTVTAVDGLQPGEIVATNGFDKLQDGAKVSVRTPGNSSGSGQGGQPGAQPGQGTPAGKSGQSNQAQPNSNSGNQGASGRKGGSTQ
jgi:multidrug efflux system membrane fusion protein